FPRRPRRRLEYDGGTRQSSPATPRRRCARAPSESSAPVPPSCLEPSADHDEAILERERGRFDSEDVDPRRDIPAILILEIPPLEIADLVAVAQLGDEVARHGVDLDPRLVRQVGEMDLVGAGRVPGRTGAEGIRHDDDALEITRRTRGGLD